MTQNDLGKSKRTVNQGKPGVVDLESQHREVTSSPVENNIQEDSSGSAEQQVSPKGKRISLGFKIVHGLAALAAFFLVVTSVVIKALRSELGTTNIIQFTATIMFRASNLVLPVTSFKDKFIRKLESNKVGKIFSDTVGTIWKILTSKSVMRLYAIWMSVLTIMSNSKPMRTAAAVISLIAILYNVIKENLEIRAANKLMQEYNLLKQHAEHKQKQSELIKMLESSELPDLQSFIKEYKTSLEPKREEQEFKVNVKTSRVAEIFRAVRNNTLETFVILDKCIAGEAIDQAIAAFITLGSVTGEVHKSLHNKKEKYSLQKANNKLQMEIAIYKNLEELRTIERQERIRTEALTRLVKEVQAGGLNQLPEERFTLLCKEAQQENSFNARNSHNPKQTAENIELQQKQVSNRRKSRPITKDQIKPSVALPYIKELRSKIRGR